MLPPGAICCSKRAQIKPSPMITTGLASNVGFETPNPYDRPDRSAHEKMNEFNDSTVARACTDRSLV
jgi:hypothetical protein